MSHATERKKARRHPEKALNAAFVRTVAKPGKYFDGNGLFLKVEASGSRRWLQRIVVLGRRTEIGPGSALLVSLAEARTVASENRKLARAGGDPLAAKRAAAAQPTFVEAATTVFEIHRPNWRSAKHAQQFISSLRTYAFPHIGSLKVSDVTTAHVLAVLQPIWLSKAETAGRVRQRIGMIMKWAVANGWRQDDPTSTVPLALPKQDRTPRHRVALPYARVADCVAAVRLSKASMATKLVFEFLVLTAARSGEARGACWSEIDLESSEWKIPADRMKSKRPHRVPLSTRAVEVLRVATRLNGASGLVFPSSRCGKPLSDNTLKKLVTELGFAADIHGFRTSFKTWCQERTEAPREVSEMALAHTIQNKSEAAYARSDLFEKRRHLMQRWNDYLMLTNHDDRQGEARIEI